ncbi:BirA family transcriptional regulator, biotin operon repressor / biotin-[acetyl-CoA-carboxylase] ligase [Parapedobacter luteus]|uniref:BirA family transcriptional regulator, biotin operon repressor / biotin-[acetyl-CoA-carboxylase] ligase n=1 Tax=Parapedobacter luteus TaxID=623280 RepID=A0A1T5D2D7_9SPHI|nr:biotin--[acetyl-CoA-carboxylase] ligase [Parapedobacter luteus]SKB65650.1 BirA family transcriptional regulator, biotin operon repressor / biotin-[acetyl-CoA-carboxylase] ligase [Parapedobacter luteus]
MQSNTFSGLFEGQNVITLQRTPSTNEFLKKELSKSTPLAEGTVIMAVDQYAGRGQKDAIWHSEPGKNLTFSLLLTPTFLNPKHQFHLTVAISLAVAQWLEALLKTPVKIKWPNDIYIGDKKIGGILIENILAGKTWKSAIVGIGINVNQTVFPDPISKQVTSIKQILHNDSNIPKLLAELCNHIGHAYQALKKESFDTLLATYRKRLYRFGETHPFLVDGVKVTGALAGVTEAGRLQIDFEGHVVDFDIKEIAFVI